MVFVTEAFFDRKIIRSSDNISIIRKLPKRECVVISQDKPYEGKFNAYYSILVDENYQEKYRMYYRAQKPGKKDYTCLVASRDGLNFKKLNLVNNANILKDVVGGMAHNFFPMLHKSEYLAIAGHDTYSSGADGVYILQSKDGIEWIGKRKIIDKKDAIRGFKKTYFDSHNQIVYNTVKSEFILYIRHNPRRGVRSVQICTSKDLISFTPMKQISFSNLPFTPTLSIYNTNITNYPDSPYFIGLPCLQKGNDKKTKFVSLTFSRDGFRWTKTIRSQLFKRCIAPYRAASGLVKSLDGKKFYLYVDDFSKGEVVCYSYSAHRMNELKVMGSGTLETKLIRLITDRITVNYGSHNKNGFLIVELVNKYDAIVHRSDELKGNELSKLIRWTSHSKKVGKRYRIRFILQDCSLYSFSYDTSVENLI